VKQISLRLDFQRHRAENVFGSLISTKLDRRGYQSTTCLNCRIYPEFTPKKNKKNSNLLKVPYNQYMKIDCLIAQTKWKTGFIRLSLQQHLGLGPVSTRNLLVLNIGMEKKNIWNAKLAYPCSSNWVTYII
jgi:predicted nucleic-acid-binding Zn-ribbon protein